MVSGIGVLHFLVVACSEVVYFDMLGVNAIHVSDSVGARWSLCLGALSMGTESNWPKMNSLSIAGSEPCQRVCGMFLTAWW